MAIRAALNATWDWVWLLNNDAQTTPEALDELLAVAGKTPTAGVLGSLLLELIRRSGVRRALVAGGDTSSHAVRRLGMEALTFAGLLSPGAPLCRGYSSDPLVDGLELVLKGGQVVPPEFFEMVRTGLAIHKGNR